MRAYLALTKPGIVRGNLLVGAAGFLFAANGTIDWWLLLAFLVGTALIIASGCVFNNVLDRDMDARMERTKSRATVTGDITSSQALGFAVILGILGAVILVNFVSLLVCVLGLAGLFGYVVVYGYAKRTTPLSTIIGSLPGAVPPAAGYVAVTGQFDGVAALLFIVMALWQMPHFYAISIYRRDDYKRAAVPVWSVAHGLKAARTHVIIFAVLYAIATYLFVWLTDVGIVYLIAMGLASSWWLWLALQGLKLKEKDLPRWAKKIFGVSLLIVLIWSAVLSLNWLLP